MGEVVRMDEWMGVPLSAADWALLHVLARRQGISATTLAGHLIGAAQAERRAVPAAAQG
jgi:hypothetical protein